jgi:hypothetical protein
MAIEVDLGELFAYSAIGLASGSLRRAWRCRHSYAGSSGVLGNGVSSVGSSQLGCEKYIVCVFVL